MMFPNGKSVLYLILAFFLVLSYSCSRNNDEEDPEPSFVELISVNVGTEMLSLTGENKNLPVNQPIVVRFNTSLDATTMQSSILLLDQNSNPVQLTVSLFDNNKMVSLAPQSELNENSVYRLSISDGLKGSRQETFEGLSVNFQTQLRPLTLQSLMFNSQLYYQTARMQDVELEPEIRLTLSHPVSLNEMAQKVRITLGNVTQEITVSATTGNKEFTVKPASALEGLMKYSLAIDETLTSESGNQFDGFQATFYTKPDLTPKFPVIPDDELLTLVQRQTFKYFWDFAHPVSGLARERNTSGEIVTTGGSGFGLMAILVGIERGFISRNEGIDRLQKIVDFLAQADRFHGAWSHWLNGTTGKVYPFSTNDDGGDLVETSFLVSGLITVRQYLNPSVPDEKDLIDQINELWRAVEWDWYTQGGRKVLYWHWSPNYAWAMNHQIKGYNEALITYLLAASSPSHPVGADVYHEGWAGNGSIANGKDFYGIKLPLGTDYGGPLFFTHYSFLGLNPHDLTDQYTNYWTQNVNHSMINRAFCIENPNQYIGYGSSCWGLTASDGNQEYYAHSPTSDRGVITPTAAISSIPYTPEESMEAQKFFYYVLGDRLWGEYGFYDAFNLTEAWTANSYLAIDQGPIIVMIENYRSGLLWNLFMSAPEVKAGLTKLGFSSPLIQ
ncbi:MAG: glucoamylase family protein [Mangrovibacterium sp.]